MFFMADQELFIGFDRKEKDKKIILPLDSLKRHFAALGSSGSGKTVLVKAIMEECVRNNIPLLIIDLQGDLASLALMGDRDFVRSKGVDGDVYDEYKEKAQVAIYTPSSSKGISISMNPLKAPPDNLDHEDLIQAIDAVAETVTGILEFDPLKGKGREVKSYLCLMPEAIWSDPTLDVDTFGELANHITHESNILDDSAMAMLDDKTKAGLAKKVKTMTIGADSLIFNLGIPMDVERMMNWSDKGKVPVNVLYLNTLRKASDKVNFIADVAQQVYNWMLRHPSEQVQLVFVLDELAGLVPPIRNPPTKKSIQLLLKQARKYGVSLLLATQNISDVDYKSLGQVGTWALGRLMARQDIEKIKDIVESISPLEVDDIISNISNQKTGQFMLLAPDVYDSVQRIQARWLVTHHTTLDDEAVRKLVDETGIRDKFPEARSKSGKIKGEETAGEGSSSIRAPGEIGAPLVVESEDSIPVVANKNKLEKVFEEKPIALTADELASQIGDAPSNVAESLDKLVDSNKLIAEEIDGVKVYWSKEHKMDPSRNLVGPLHRFHIKFAQKSAGDVMKKHRSRRERVINQKVIYVPFWRINGNIEVVLRKRLRRDDYEMVNRYFYVNGANGGILDYDKKEKEIHFPIHDVDPEKIRTIENLDDFRLEKITVDNIGDDFFAPKINRQEAINICHQKLALDVTKSIVPAIYFVPMWQFDLMDKKDKFERSGWVDALFGTYTEINPVTGEESRKNPLNF